MPPRNCVPSTCPEHSGRGTAVSTGISFPSQSSYFSSSSSSNMHRNPWDRVSFENIGGHVWEVVTRTTDDGQPSIRYTALNAGVQRVEMPREDWEKMRIERMQRRAYRVQSKL
jgi:hypothetical protein